MFSRSTDHEHEHLFLPITISTSHSQSIQFTSLQSFPSQVDHFLLQTLPSVRNYLPLFREPSFTIPLMTTPQTQQAPGSPQQGTQQAAPSFSTWTCHDCTAGPHSHSLERCTGLLSNGNICNHTVCPKCPKDDNVPPPGVSGNDWNRGKEDIRREVKKSTATFSASHTAQGAITPSSSNALPPPSHRRDGQITQSTSRSVRNMPRVDTRGWWRCCHCRNPMNPALAPTRCSICNHPRCGACRAV